MRGTYLINWEQYSFLILRPVLSGVWVMLKFQASQLRQMLVREGAPCRDDFTEKPISGSCLVWNCLSVNLG